MRRGCIILHQLDQRLLLRPFPLPCSNWMKSVTMISEEFMQCFSVWSLLVCSLLSYCLLNNSSEYQHGVVAALGRYCSHTCLANILKFDSYLQMLVKMIYRIAAILDYGATKITTRFDTKRQCMDFGALFSHGEDNLDNQWKPACD